MTAEIEESFPHNGAAIMAERDVRGRPRFAVFNAAGGEPVRKLYDRDEAIAFARGLPVPAGLPDLLPEPGSRSISPRAHALRASLGMDVYVPVAEPGDGAPAKTMSGARARSGAGPSARKPEARPRPRVPT
jgi:hypothetical protein